MKFIAAGEGFPVPVVELTRRNLETLLAKLDDPLSARMLVDGDVRVAVRAIADGDVAVVAVEDVEHYSDRDPGVVFMPSSGVYR